MFEYAAIVTTQNTTTRVPSFFNLGSRRTSEVVRRALGSYFQQNCLKSNDNPYGETTSEETSDLLFYLGVRANKWVVDTRNFTRRQTAVLAQSPYEHVCNYVCVYIYIYISFMCIYIYYAYIYIYIYYLDL